jgi:hypothetical protein
MTKNMGYKKGGQTIDSLVLMAPNYISRLRQNLCFENGGKMVD